MARTPSEPSALSELAPLRAPLARPLRDDGHEGRPRRSRHHAGALGDDGLGAVTSATSGGVNGTKNESCASYCWAFRVALMLTGCSGDRLKSSNSSAMNDQFATAI